MKWDDEKTLLAFTVFKVQTSDFKLAVKIFLNIDDCQLNSKLYEFKNINSKRASNTSKLIFKKYRNTKNTELVILAKKIMNK